jgi:pSer/pThr/pTyr-binding forkhead associated (FHA) protein
MRLRFTIRAKSGKSPASSLAPVLERAVEVSLADGEVIIGRGQGKAIALPFPTISGRHARIFREGGGYRIVDLGSANGTLLGTRRLVPHVAEIVAVGDVIDLAGIELRLDGELPAKGASPAEEGTATLARRLVHDIFEACPPAECARLAVVAGVALGRELVLTTCGRTFKLGRGEQCDLAIPDDDISREHAAFERGADGIVVRDLGSKNGVEVDGQKISGSRILRDGEIVCLGKTRLRVIDPEERYLHQIEEGAVKAPGEAVDVGRDGEGAASSAASPAQLADSPVPAVVQDRQPSPSSLPLVAAAIAVTSLLLALGIALALAFAG